MEPLHLRHIDPNRNMARYYTVIIQPTLFGRSSPVRNWGQIGTNGQAKVETFDKVESAHEALLYRANQAAAQL